MSLYLVTVATSGERKSTADRIASRAAEDRQAHLWERHADECRAFEDQQELWKRRRSEAVGEGDSAALGSLRGEQPQEPRRPVLTVEEPTTEALIDAAHRGQPTLGVFTDEGGIFLSGHSWHPERRLKLCGVLSKLWDGTPYTDVRRGRPTVRIDGARVSLHLMMQPAMAQKLLSDDTALEQGLLSRVLLAAPESTIGSRELADPTPEEEAALNRYRKRIGSLIIPYPSWPTDSPERATSDAYSSAASGRPLTIPRR